MKSNLSLSNELAGTKILFANFPADGHFNPLTGLAVYLDQLGCDVRWYTSKTYADKLKKLQIKHYPFKEAVDVQSNNFDEAFPDRMKQKTQISKLKFDIKHAFILRGPEYYADILSIQKEFAFDLLIADCAFTAIPFVKELMKIPVISIGVMPLSETSKDLPPAGLGMTPSYSFAGKLKQALLRKISDKFIFGEPNRLLQQIFDRYGIPHKKESLFDMIILKSDLLLQSGTPGFEYYRSDLSNHIRYVGALLPYMSHKKRDQWFDDRLNRYKKVILVTQGTVERDVNKIIVPTLEAFKDSDTLVVATTGGSDTEKLKQAYPQQNFIIEDFIPFADIMPYADVYITNGGYGGVMLGIQNNLPMVVAGLNEGKNEICARVGYFHIGINLKTETPAAAQIKKAADEVMTNGAYRYNITKLAEEFAGYDPYHLSAGYVAGLLNKNSAAGKIYSKLKEKIY